MFQTRENANIVSALYTFSVVTITCDLWIVIHEVHLSKCNGMCLLHAKGKGKSPATHA